MEKIDKGSIAKGWCIERKQQITGQQQVMSRITLMSTLDESTKFNVQKWIDCRFWWRRAFNLGGFLRDSNERLRGDAFIELVAKSHITRWPKLKKWTTSLVANKTDQNINETLKKICLSQIWNYLKVLYCSTNLESVAMHCPKIKQDLSSGF